MGTLQIVFAPLVLDLGLHHLAPRFVKLILPVSSLVSVLTITLNCANIIDSSAEDLRRSGVILLLEVLLLHAGGFSFGYLLTPVLGYETINCRTISPEVGMPTSGLGAVLVQRHFSQMHLAALPCAVSATFHSVIGSIIAGIWGAAATLASGSKFFSKKCLRGSDSWIICRCSLRLEQRRKLLTVGAVRIK